MIFSLARCISAAFFDSHSFVLGRYISGRIRTSRIFFFERLLFCLFLPVMMSLLYNSVSLEFSRWPFFLFSFLKNRVKLPRRLKRRRKCRKSARREVPRWKSCARNRTGSTTTAKWFRSTNPALDIRWSWDSRRSTTPASRRTTTLWTRLSINSIKI